MNNLVTFIGRGDSDHILVGIGLTNKTITHLIKCGGILQTGDRNQTGIDITLLYEPTERELVKKIKSIIPEDRTEVRVI